MSPNPGVLRGRSAWLTAFIFSESLAPNYPGSPRDGHNLGHSCLDIAHYRKPAVADWQRRYRRLFELAELNKPTGTRKRCSRTCSATRSPSKCCLPGVRPEQAAILLGHKNVEIITADKG